MTDCGICMDVVTEQGFINCSHLFCFECILRWAGVNNSCPVCKRRFRVVTKQPLDTSNRKRPLRGAPKYRVKDRKPRPEDFFDIDEHLAAQEQQQQHMVNHVLGNFYRFGDERYNSSDDEDFIVASDVDADMEEEQMSCSGSEEYDIEDVHSEDDEDEYFQEDEDEFVEPCEFSSESEFDVNDWFSGEPLDLT